MVTILMMWAKMAFLDLLKIKIFIIKGYDVITSVYDVINKIYRMTQSLLYIRSSEQSLLTLGLLLEKLP